MRNFFRVFIIAGILLHTIIGAPLLQIGDETGCKESWAQNGSPVPPPIDIFFVFDLSANLADDLDRFKTEASAILSQLVDQNPDIRFGIGRFEDYPIPPFGNTYFADKAYERVLDLTPNVELTLATFDALAVRSGGDEPESQLAAVFQAATGVGQDLTAQGYRLAGIAAGQQANFREAAQKLLILWTDSPFHEPGDVGAIPYPGPGFEETAGAVEALSGAKVLGISSGTEGLSHLQRIVTETSALAPAGGVDCDADGAVDIVQGEPLVCTTSLAGEGIADAMLAVIGAAINDISFPNLRVTRIDMPGTVGVPAQISAEWLVKNDGLSPAEGTWSEKVFLSEDENLDAQDTLLGEFVFSDGIESAVERWRSSTLDIPAMPPGPYFVIVQTDANNQVDESDENDNTLAMPIEYLRIKQFTAAPDQITIGLYPGEAVHEEIDLVNLSETPLTGIVAAIEGNSPNISIQVDPPSDMSGKTVQKVSYSVSASDDSVTNNSPVLTFVSAEGEIARVTFNITVNPGYPKLVSNPAYLETTMVRGTQNFLEFEVSNVGSAPVTNLQTVLPSTDWLSLFTPGSLHSLDRGEKIKVGLALKPPADLPLGPYTGTLALNADNAATSVGFRFTAVSDQIGGLKIVAKDEFTYFADDHPPVVGAAVKISNPYDGTVIAEGVTDGEGQFLKDDLPEALYSIEVRAEKHGTYNAVVQIHPEETREITAFLSMQLVSYTWKVEPVQTEDRYVVTLEAVFETHVPAPVITVEPTILDLSGLQYDANGKAVVNYTVTNHGLIAANGASIRFGSHPDYTMTTVSENIGEIPPMTSMVIPVEVSKLSNAITSEDINVSANSSESSSSGCGIPVVVDYYYVCENNQWRLVTVYALTGTCPQEQTPSIGVINLPRRGSGGLGIGDWGDPVDWDALLKHLKTVKPWIQQSVECVDPACRDECCDKALEDGKNWGVVRCCNSTLIMCVKDAKDFGTPSNILNNIMRTCVIEHENTHMDNAIGCSSQNNECEPSGYLLGPGSTTECEECEGYRAEISCLENSKIQCTEVDAISIEKCKEYIDCRILAKKVCFKYGDCNGTPCFDITDDEDSLEEKCPGLKCPNP